jgi:hypothetical protein
MHDAINKPANAACALNHKAIDLQPSKVLTLLKMTEGTPTTALTNLGSQTDAGIWDAPFISADTWAAGSPRGGAVDLVAASSHYINVSVANAAESKLHANGTFGLVFTADTVAAGDACLLAAGSAADATYSLPVFRDGSTLEVGRQYSLGSISTPYYSWTITTGVVYVLVVTWSSTGGILAYLNGVLGTAANSPTSDTSGFNPATGAKNKDLRIGGWSSGDYWDGQIYEFLWSSVAWTAAQAKLFTADPFALLRPEADTDILNATWSPDVAVLDDTTNRVQVAAAGTIATDGALRVLTATDEQMDSPTAEDTQLVENGTDDATGMIFDIAMTAGQTKYGIVQYAGTTSPGDGDWQNLPGGRFTLKGSPAAASAATKVLIPDTHTNEENRRCLSGEVGDWDAMDDLFAPEVEGTAQSATASTIVLEVGDVSDDDALVALYIQITGGTGEGQVRRIDDSTGATDSCDISPDWDTNPDATSTYRVWTDEEMQQRLIHRIAEAAAAVDPDSITELGDGVYLDDAADAATRRAFAKHYMLVTHAFRKTAPLMHVPGNHEGTQSDGGAAGIIRRGVMESNFVKQEDADWGSDGGTENCYKEVIGDLLLIHADVVFNSVSTPLTTGPMIEFGTNQKALIEAWVAESHQHRAIVLHNLAGKDHGSYDWYGWGDGLEQASDRADNWPSGTYDTGGSGAATQSLTDFDWLHNLCKANDVHVFYGHGHRWFSALVDTVRYFQCGNASRTTPPNASLFDSDTSEDESLFYASGDTRGFVQLDVTAATLTVTFKGVDLEGTVTELYSVALDAGSPDPPADESSGLTMPVLSSVLRMRGGGR